MAPVSEIYLGLSRSMVRPGGRPSAYILNLRPVFHSEFLPSPFRITTAPDFLSAFPSTTYPFCVPKTRVLACYLILGGPYAHLRRNRHRLRTVRRPIARPDSIQLPTAVLIEKRKAQRDAQEKERAAALPANHRIILVPADPSYSPIEDELLFTRLSGPIPRFSRKWWLPLIALSTNIADGAIPSPPTSIAPILPS